MEAVDRASSGVDATALRVGDADRAAASSAPSPAGGEGDRREGESDETGGTEYVRFVSKRGTVAVFAVR